MNALLARCPGRSLANPQFPLNMETSPLMDNTSDPIAQTDQELRHVAVILGAHFRGLLREGFERCEAMELTRDLQGEMIGGDEDE